MESGLRGMQKEKKEQNQISFKKRMQTKHKAVDDAVKANSTQHNKQTRRIKKQLCTHDHEHDS